MSNMDLLRNSSVSDMYEIWHIAYRNSFLRLCLSHIARPFLREDITGIYSYFSLQFYWRNVKTICRNVCFVLTSPLLHIVPVCHMSVATWTMLYVWKQTYSLHRFQQKGPLDMQNDISSVDFCTDFYMTYRCWWVWCRVCIWKGCRNHARRDMPYAFTYGLSISPLRKTKKRVLTQTRRTLWRRYHF